MNVARSALFDRHAIHNIVLFVTSDTAVNVNSRF